MMVHRIRVPMDRYIMTSISIFFESTIPGFESKKDTIKTITSPQVNLVREHKF